MKEDTIDVFLMKGSGNIPDGFEEFLNNKSLFGHEFTIHEVHAKAAIDYITAAIIISLPLSILGRIFRRFTEDIGDNIYNTLKKFIREFFFQNLNNCNFSVATSIENDGFETKVKIIAADFNHTNIDRFFDGFPISIDDILTGLELPEKANGVLYLRLYAMEYNIRILWHSTKSNKQYEYHLRDSKWIDLTIVEYKCQYCMKILSGPSNEFSRFNVCPYCGKLYSETVNYIKKYFRIIQLSPLLTPCIGLLIEGKFDTAVREAIIALENAIKSKSDLKDSFGKELISKAFGFDYDQKTESIIRSPLIMLNDLSSLSKRNEQEGARLMLMGFMQGIRNIYMHGKGASNLYYAIQIITLIDTYCNTIIGLDKSIATYSEQ